MKYKVKSAWIFVVMFLIVVLMILFPSSWSIWLGIIVVPLLIIYQVVIVLRANESSEHTFSDEKWYDHS